MHTLRFVTLCLVFAILAGCGGADGDTTSQPAPGRSGSTAALAQSAADTDPAQPNPTKADKQTAFALETADANSDGGTLALTLAFNKPLAGAQAFDKLARVTDAAGDPVAGGWALSANGKTLRFTPVEANTSYHVLVEQALAAADGSVLASALDKTITTGQLQPSVSFASMGSVLPAHGSRGLPVMAVNTPQVDVDFYRVRNDALSDFFAAYTHNGMRNGWQLDPDNPWRHRPGRPLTRVADSVFSHRFTLDCQANQRCINYLPIGDIEQLSQPGVYMAVMRAAGSLQNSYATNVFYVSDIGLHMRVYDRKVFVHAASLETGEPLDEVKLEVLGDDGRPQASARTDEQGNALVDYDFDSADVLRATLDGDVAMLPFNRPALNLSAFDVAGRKHTALDIFTWSGRDLYRPGETLRVSALLRDYDGRMVKPQPLFVEVKQPDGRRFASSRLEPGALGYYLFKQALPEAGPTGTWQLEFRLDPGSDEPLHTLALHVEEFLPERLDLSLDSAHETITSGQPLKLQVQSNYLYGAPASNNRFSATLALEVARHPVTSLADYWFGDPSIDLPEGVRDVLDAKLDDNGELRTDIKLFQAEPPATPVTAIVSGKVFETGGRAVTRVMRRSVWPADALVGVHPDFDPEQGATPNARVAFDLVRSNRAGALLAAEDLEVRLEREHRRYHWYWTDAGGWNFDWSSRYQTIDTRSVSIAEGQSLKLDFRIEYGGYRLSITDPATGLTMRYPFHAGWGWSADNANRGARPDKVQLTLDQPGYRAGDTLSVTVTPPKPGPGLLLVESDHLLYHRAIQAEAGARFEIPVTEAWMRHDVYITVLVFRGGVASQHTTPARAVGEVHVPIERARRKLELHLSAPTRMRPNHDLKVSIDAPQLAGKQAKVTFSAVDVGVLNITDFPLPDPFAWFFGQRAFGIEAHDVYARVIEAFKGGVARLAWGGDMAMQALPQASRARAKQEIVDLFSGPITFDAEGHAEASLAMPEFNGTVRISAVAFGEKDYGSARTETLVRAPIVLQASTPRVMAPGDQSLLSVDVTNFTGHEAKISVTAKAGPALAIEQAEQTLTLAQGASATLAMPVTAQPHFGSASIDIQAQSGTTSVHIDRNMAVRPAWPAVTRSRTQVLEQAEAVAFPRNLVAGLIPPSVNARLTLTTLPPLPFATVLKDLLDYRYGCLEQTISKGYAALVATPSLATALHIEPLGADPRRQRVRAALQRLASLQLASGHFNMWGPSGQPATFLTPYAADFLLDAREAGFDVDPSMLQRTLERLKEDLLRGGPRFYGRAHADHLRFAYKTWAAYELARVRRAPLGTLRNLFEHKRDKSLTGLPLVHLGIALKLMGDKPRGDKALAAGFAKGFERPHWLRDYGSELRDMARMVALTHKHELARPAWDARLIDLARRQASREHKAKNHDWRVSYSTNEQAALARLASQLLKGSGSKVQGTWRAGDAVHEIEPTMLWSRLLDGDALRKGVAVMPDGSATLYVISDASGVPKQAPQPNQDTVAISRDYFTLDGKRWKGEKPLTVGTALVVRVKIEAREDLPDALVTELLPGGLEVENLNLADSQAWSDVRIDGVDVRGARNNRDIKHEGFLADRYVAALELESGEVTRLYYLVRAVSPGQFLVPPPRVADMYRPDLKGIGVSQPQYLTVVQPGTAEKRGAAQHP